VDLLRNCLASVIAYAPPGTEILVVDDASPSGIVTATAANFPGVRVIQLPRHSGFAIAANTGIAAATTPIVELLNDDTVVTPHWTDSPLRLFANPAIAAVAPLVLQLDPARQAAGLPPLIDSAGDSYDPGGFAQKRCHNQIYLPDAAVPRSQIPVPNSASASAAFYRRSAVLAVGGFPPHFGAYFEDVDLSLRLRRLGHEIHFDPDSIVWHRVSASYGRKPTRRLLEQQSCNEERLFWRNSSLRHIPRHLAVLAAKAARRTLEGTLTPWATGRFRAWLDSILSPSPLVGLVGEGLGVRGKSQYPPL